MSRVLVWVAVADGVICLRLGSTIGFVSFFAGLTGDGGVVRWCSVVENSLIWGGLVLVPGKRDVARQMSLDEMLSELGSEMDTSGSVIGGLGVDRVRPRIDPNREYSCPAVLPCPSGCPRGRALSNGTLPA